MNTRASRAVPIYIFLPSSFLRAKWHKFCFLCAPFKPRRREKCFDLGTNRHRNKSLVRTVQTFPLATLQRVFLARVPYIVLYILSLPSPFRQFSSPLIFPPLLLAAPRSPFASLVLPSLCLRSAFAPFAHPFDSRSKEKSERIVRKEPLKTVTCALQNARQSLRNPPQKQKNADFLKFFESKSCSVQKVAVLLHSLTEKTGMPVRSERQQKFFEKIP